CRGDVPGGEENECGDERVNRRNASASTIHDGTIHARSLPESRGLRSSLTRYEPRVGGLRPRIGGWPVYRGNLAAHRTQVGGELTAMVDSIEEAHPQELADRQLRDHLALVVELCRLIPGGLVQLRNAILQRFHRVLERRRHLLERLVRRVFPLTPALPPHAHAKCAFLSHHPPTI